MSKEIPGVPESITRADYIKLFESVGIQPGNTKELSFRADGVYATVFAVDEKGVKTLSDSGDGYNKHSIYIPVED